MANWQNNLSVHEEHDGYSGHSRHSKYKVLGIVNMSDGVVVVKVLYHYFYPK